MKTFRKVTVLSSDKKQKKEDFMSNGSHSKDLKEAKKFFGSKGYTVKYVSKTLYDTYGDVVKSKK